MKDKKTLWYAIIIIVLVAILGVLWFLMVSGNNNSNNSGNQGNKGPGMNNDSNTTYSGVKEITKDETITSGEYKSSNADENAILVSGAINAFTSN